MQIIRVIGPSIGFLALLSVATLGAGMAYENGLNLLHGQGDAGTGMSFVVGAIGLVFTLIVLGRIAYLTTPRSRME